MELLHSKVDEAFALMGCKETCLDISHYGAYATPWMAREVDSITSVHPDPMVLKSMRENMDGIDLIRGDPRDEIPGGGEYELVVCWMTMLQYYDRECELVAEEIEEHLEEEGTLLLFEPSKSGDQYFIDRSPEEYESFFDELEIVFKEDYRNENEGSRGHMMLLERV